MNRASRTKWQIRGEEIASCNCAWGCPCQFNARPTTGHCEALTAWEIRQGYFGDVRLDGVRFAGIYRWPGAVHEGNGTHQMIIDSRTAPEQREALIALESAAHGGAFFEIFAAVCPNRLEPVVAPIELQLNREQRRATVRITDIGEIQAEPIKNPVTGEEHRARIDLPNGFEYKQAECGNSVHLRVRSGDKLAFEHHNTHAHFNVFDWTNA